MLGQHTDSIAIGSFLMSSSPMLAGLGLPGAALGPGQCNMAVRLGSTIKRYNEARRPPHQVVTDDVGLLQEQAHVVGQLLCLEELLGLQA